MLFSENPDVYIKKQVQIWIQRPQITLNQISLFLSFFQTENLLHSVINDDVTFWLLRALCKDTLSCNAI